MKKALLLLIALSPLSAPAMDCNPTISIYWENPNSNQCTPMSQKDQFQIFGRQLMMQIYASQGIPLMREPEPEYISHKFTQKKQPAYTALHIKNKNNKRNNRTINQPRK